MTTAPVAEGLHVGLQTTQLECHSFRNLYFLLELLT
jgi:hypothetical protein